MAAALTLTACAATSGRNDAATRPRVDVAMEKGGAPDAPRPMYEVMSASADSGIPVGHWVGFTDDGSGWIVLRVYQDEDGKLPVPGNPWHGAHLSRISGLPVLGGMVEMQGDSATSHPHAAVFWFGPQEPTKDPKLRPYRVDAVFIHPPSAHPELRSPLDDATREQAANALASLFTQTTGRQRAADVQARATGMHSLITILWHNGTWHGSGD